MPDEDASDSVEDKPPDNPLINSAIQPIADQPPPSAPTENNASREDNATAELRDIRKGESWLIGVGVATLVVNSIIALIYYGQLGEMRKATEASTRAVQLAQDSFEISDGDFQRTMNQIIAQTAAQLKSADAAKNAADATLGQLVVMQNQLEFQRPRLEIPGFDPKNPPQLISPVFTVKPRVPKVPQTFTIDFGIKVRNTGISPARIGLNPRYLLMRLDNDDVPHLTVAMKRVNPKDDLCENQTNVGPRFLNLLSQNSEDTVSGRVENLVSDDQPPSIQAPPLWTNLSACIVYYGPSGDRHWLKLIYHIYFDHSTSSMNGFSYHPIKDAPLVYQLTDSYNFTPH